MIASLCQKGIVSTVHKHARINKSLHKHEHKIEQRLWLGFETISRLTTVLLGIFFEYSLVSKRRTTGKSENMNALTAAKLLNKSLWTLISL